MNGRDGSKISLSSTKIEELSPKELAELDELLTEVFIPDNKEQYHAYRSDADELFFGGKAGTGKSYLTIALAAFEHTNSVIFRREFAQMRGGDGIIAKSQDIIAKNGRYNSGTGIWQDVFGKRTIELAGLENEKAVNKHKGRARDFHAFDEITEFTQHQYETIIPWNRTSIKGQRCRVLATGNPPTNQDGEWVIGYWGPWLDPSHPLYPYEHGELVWFAQVDGEEVFSTEYKEYTNNDGSLVKPRSRSFISGEMVSYLKETGYDQVLQNLREPLRSKLLLGDFTVKVKDDLFQVIPTAWIEAAQERWSQTKPDGVGLTAMGVDVSRGGVDKTVIAKRYGTWFAELIVHAAKEMTDGGKVATAVMEAMETPCQVNLDVVNVGVSPYDILVENDVTVFPINGAEASATMDKMRKYRMRNKRAALWWTFAEALEPGSGKSIELPAGDTLKRDLASARFQVTTQGIKIEDKEIIKGRIGRSPDEGEAVIMCWNEGDVTIRLSDIYGDIGQKTPLGGAVGERF